RRPGAVKKSVRPAHSPEARIVGVAECRRAAMLFPPQKAGQKRIQNCDRGSWHFRQTSRPVVAINRGNKDYIAWTSFSVEAPFMQPPHSGELIPHPPQVKF
ncbi:MAG: hypothetical protein ACREC8_07895, partial [Limisphaerales bacterium]